MSVSATTTVLEDRSLYPHFFRVVPDDRIQVKVRNKELDSQIYTVSKGNDSFIQNTCNVRIPYQVE